MQPGKRLRKDRRIPVLLACFGPIQPRETRVLSQVFTVDTMYCPIHRASFSTQQERLLTRSNTENRMRSSAVLISASLFALFTVPLNQCQNSPTQSPAPLRVGIVGLVHGHVQGFFEHSLHSPVIEIVGIAEADQSLSSRYAKQYAFDPRIRRPFSFIRIHTIIGASWKSAPVMAST